MYRYTKYALWQTCTQVVLIHKLFEGGRLQSTRTLWAKSLCKLVTKNERSLSYRETSPGLSVGLLVKIDDVETIGEFDRRRSKYPGLLLSQTVQFESRQEADEIGNW